jgi:glycosyltransferase involved in cell wall biosynthesis
MSEAMNITVLMPVYNDSAYLETSIRSILNQSFGTFEFLIIDDGSDDDSGKIVKSFKDQRIVYRKIKHTGLAGALNYGLRNSTGNWIARIDADDICTFRRLEVQAEYIRQNPDVDVVSTWSVYFNNDHKILFNLKTPVNDRKIKEFLNLHNPVNHSSVIFKKSKILSGGAYNEQFKCYEDFELWFRLRNELTFAILPEYLVYTRMRDDSMTVRGSRKMIYDLLNSNANSKLEKAVSPDKKNYWSSILFWIEYFYGDKNKARQFFEGEVSMKKTLAYLNTFLPENEFEKLIGLRLRQRINFRLEFGNKFTEELAGLLNK